MLFSSRNYAIGMAHYQIGGGTRMLAILCCGFAAIATLVISFVLYNGPVARPPMVIMGLYSMFMMIQSAILILFGASRISNSMRLDVNSNMIESHRQMPISAARAMLGYMFGATAHVLALAGVNCIVLVVLSVLAGRPPTDVVLAMIMLLSFTVFIWTYAAVGTQMFRQSVALMVMSVLLVIVLSALRATGILPAVSLLSSPFTEESLLAIASVTSLPTSSTVGIVGQFAFASIFFVGACRRYRGTYATTFNAPLALGLVLVWNLLSIYAIHWPVEARVVRFGDTASEAAQIVSALTISSILALVVVHALVAWEGRNPGKPGISLATLGAAMLAGSMTILAASSIDQSPWLVTVLVMIIHVLTAYFGFRAFSRFTPTTRGTLLGALFIGLWLGPFLIQAILWIMEGERRNVSEQFTTIVTASPLGLLITQWINQGGVVPAERLSPVPGLLIQSVIVVMLWRLDRMFVAREQKGGPSDGSALTAVTPPVSSS